MALNSITKKRNQGRDIKYLNKDFESFRKNLIEYTKTYFPQTYSDFNESSPGMMFMEMASYIGDTLSYYIDDSLKESMMLYAEDKENVVNLARYLGYKSKVTTPALVQIAVYQLVPSVGTGDENSPDSRFYLRIREGMLVESRDTSTLFRTTELLDFNVVDGREISVHEVSSVTGEPTFYLIKKYVNAISGTPKTTTKIFTSPDQFSEIVISDTNVIDVYDVRDSNDNKWYEVPYMAQEMVFVDYALSTQTDSGLSTYSTSVSNILRLIKTSRRFTTQVNSNNTTTLVFGGGNSTAGDETLIPTFKNVGLGLQSSIDKLGASFDPANFLKTQSYGQAPANTTLTVSYLVGGGVDSNVTEGQLTRIQSIEFEDDTRVFSADQDRLYQRMKTTIAVENETAATGGRGAETVEEIRQNALATFGSQNRAVTNQDYHVRALSLPPKYGGITKAHATSTKTPGHNSYTVDLYILGYNSDKKLASLNTAVKENLRTYINEYKMLTDSINIIDGFIVNIGVDFEIRVYGGYNKREVLVRCIESVTDYFNIDDWTFNMPINISELELMISGIEGVQSVPKCDITNKSQGTYSRHSYNINEATKNKMLYPSLDPSVFEVKYPGTDIQGKAV